MALNTSGIRISSSLHYYLWYLIRYFKFHSSDALGLCADFYSWYLMSAFCFGCRILKTNRVKDSKEDRFAQYYWKVIHLASKFQNVKRISAKLTNHYSLCYYSFSFFCVCFHCRENEFERRSELNLLQWNLNKDVVSSVFTKWMMILVWLMNNHWHCYSRLLIPPNKHPCLPSWGDHQDSVLFVVHSALPLRHSHPHLQLLYHRSSQIN